MRRKRSNKILVHSLDVLIQNALDTPIEVALAHSAEGSTWEKEDHKYVKKDENGNYIYPEDLEKSDREKASGEENKQEEADPNAPDDDEKVQLLGAKVPPNWLETLKAQTDKIIQEHAAMFKDSKTVIYHLLKEDNREAFKNTMIALCHCDAKILSDSLVDKMRRQLASQYGVVDDINKSPEEVQASSNENPVKFTNQSSSKKSSSSNKSSKESSKEKKEEPKKNNGFTEEDYDYMHKNSKKYS